MIMIIGTKVLQDTVIAAGIASAASNIPSPLKETTQEVKDVKEVKGKGKWGKFKDKLGFAPKGDNKGNSAGAGVPAGGEAVDAEFN